MQSVPWGSPPIQFIDSMSNGYCSAPHDEYVDDGNQAVIPLESTEPNTASENNALHLDISAAATSAYPTLAHFNTEQFLTVFGYLRQIRTSHFKPKEIILLCVWFYQSECFLSPNNMTIKSSEGSLHDIATNRNDACDHYYASVYGSFRINAKLMSKISCVTWKLHIIESCCMRIGITADKAGRDNVVSVHGDHRFYTLNDAGQVRTHRLQYGLGDTNIFNTNDIVEVILSKDDGPATIVFIVNSHRITVPQLVNFRSEYRLVIYMSMHYSMHPYGRVRLLDFNVSH